MKQPFKMRILIDTGCENINVISKRCFEKFKLFHKDLVLKPSDVKLKPVNSQPFSVLGGTIIPLRFNPNLPPSNILVVVVDDLDSYDIILGLPAIEQLNVTLNFNEGQVLVILIQQCTVY